MISANSRTTHKIAKNCLGASTVERTKESETHPLSDGPSFLKAEITLIDESKAIGLAAK
jgi:hypothetical protein